MANQYVLFAKVFRKAAKSKEVEGSWEAKNSKPDQNGSETI